MGAQCTCSPSESSEILIEPGAGTSTASKEQIKLAKPKIPEPNRFDENYQLEDGPDGSEGVLGYSSIGTVVKTRHKGSSKVHAVKQISKSKIDGDEWKGDVQAFKTLDHPNICKVHDTWEDAMNIYLVMEFCKGGQLTNLGAAEQNKVNEHAVAVLVRQMVDAVSHLHEHKMVHSDIRPENWLFEDQISDDNSGNRASVLDTQLKMVDFGFANKYGKIRSGQGQRFPSGCQAHLRGKTSRAIQEDRSLFCKAPEQVGIISGGRGSSDEVEKADVWALGIIAYFLLSGQPPFTGPPEKDALFKSASFVFMPAELWRPVSSEAKNFIAMCLQESAFDRPRADKTLNLPWMGLAKRALAEEAELKRIGRWPPATGFKATTKLSIMDPSLPSAERVKQSFSRMNQLNVLEKAAVIAAAHKLQEHRIQDLAKAYESMDKNNEGVISTKEFFDGLESCGVPCKELGEIMKGIELNGSRVIEYPEFLANIEDFQRNMQDSAVWAVFRNFDSEQNKAVLKKKLVEALGRKTARKSLAASYPELPLESVLEELDHDSNGVIEFEEFKKILRQSGSSNSTSASTKISARPPAP